MCGREKVKHKSNHLLGLAVVNEKSLSFESTILSIHFVIKNDGSEQNNVQFKMFKKI